MTYWCGGRCCVADRCECLRGKVLALDDAAREKLGGGGRVGVEVCRDGRDEGDSIDFVGDEVCGR